MVDYSGNVVDTFNMTKGLFDAYSKARTEQMGRDKMAADMQKQNEQAAILKQIGSGMQSGDMDQRRLTGMLFQGNMPSEALNAMKLAPEQWNAYGAPPMQPNAQPQPGMPQAAPARPQEPAFQNGQQPPPGAGVGNPLMQLAGLPANAGSYMQEVLKRRGLMSIG